MIFLYYYTYLLTFDIRDWLDVAKELINKI